MAKFIQKGDNIDFKNTTDSPVLYGEVIVFGKMIGIANNDIPVGAIGTISLTGVYEIPCEAVEIATGDVLYWGAENLRLTKTNTGGIIAGICIEAKATPITTAKVRL